MVVPPSFAAEEEPANTTRRACLNYLAQLVIRANFNEWGMREQFVKRKFQAENEGLVPASRNVSPDSAGVETHALGRTSIGYAYGPASLG